jgi:F0F1-type ATP synthase assembly protein I
MSPQGDFRHLERLYALGQVGAEMVAPIVIGLAIDWLANSRPWFTVVGAIVGFAGGIWHIIYLNRPRQS